MHSPLLDPRNDDPDGATDTPQPADASKPDRAQRDRSRESMERLGRALLLDQLASAIVRSEVEHREFAVLVLVTDEQAEDALWSTLRTGARRVQRALRPGDTIEQLDDRTLVAICDDVANVDDAESLARRALIDIGISCTLSVTMSGDQSDSSLLLTNALLAAPTRTTAQLPHGRAPLGLVAGMARPC